ncbi:MAG: shikimate kinase [Alphaproteobacteria bacterium]|nr:shikimate kinase [Alphaproteobacteria bacterium]
MTMPSLRPGMIAIPRRTIVMIGMPGSGKSTIARKLASRLGAPFADADQRVEEAAGMTIEQIFHRLGEAEFRKAERRVIERLLRGPMQVLATGGGAFMDDETRDLIKQQGVAVWLKADLDMLVERCSRKNDRPLLKGGDPRQVLSRLMAEREPVYAEACVNVESTERPIDETVRLIIHALGRYATTLPPEQPRVVTSA